MESGFRDKCGISSEDVASREVALVAKLEAAFKSLSEDDIEALGDNDWLLFVEELKRRVEIYVQKHGGAAGPKEIEHRAAGVAGEAMLTLAMRSWEGLEEECGYNPWLPDKEENICSGDVRLYVKPEGSVIVMHKEGGVNTSILEFDAALLADNGSLALLDISLSLNGVAKKIALEKANLYSYALRILEEGKIPVKMAHLLVNRHLPYKIQRLLEQKKYPYELVYLRGEELICMVNQITRLLMEKLFNR